MKKIPKLNPNPIRGRSTLRALATSNGVNKILSVLLLLGIAFSVITIVNAVAPNPGHNFTEVSGSIATGNLIYGQAADTFAALASVAAGSYLRSAGLSTAPVWSTLTLPNAGTTGDILFASATNVIGNLADVAVGRFLVSGGVGVAPLYSSTPTLGVAGATLGTLSLAGNTSGVITIQPQAAAGTYNFNLPIGAGTAGQPLLSGGGVGAAMTFGTLTVGAGGTGLTATADDAVLVGDSASGATARTLPTCSGATTDKLLYNISTNTFSCGVDQGGGGSSPVTVKALSATQTSSSVTPAKVTGLDQVAGAGTYVFQYFIRYQSTVAATGVRFDVNHSGTVTSFVWNQRYSNLIATASDSNADQDSILAAGVTGSMFASRAKGTAGRGTTLSVDTINADMLVIIEGIMVVTVSGNLELYFGSEATGSTQSIMLNSSLILTKIL